MEFAMASSWSRAMEKFPKCAKAGRDDGDEVVDLDGNFLAPGFIDLHLHGAVGRDTMEASADAFSAICDYHASGGTTSLLLTTVSAPIPRLFACWRRSERL